MTEEELLEIKSEIEEYKEKLSELKGQRKQALQQLEEYGCKTIKDAKEEISKLEEEDEGYSVRIEKGVKKLETDFDVL